LLVKGKLKEPWIATEDLNLSLTAVVLENFRKYLTSKFVPEKTSIKRVLELS